jgi:hypothetical protein
VTLDATDLKSLVVANASIASVVVAVMESSESYVEYAPSEMYANSVLQLVGFERLTRFNIFVIKSLIMLYMCIHGP